MGWHGASAAGDGDEVSGQERSTLLGASPGHHLPQVDELAPEALSLGGAGLGNRRAEERYKLVRVLDTQDTRSQNTH